MAPAVRSDASGAEVAATAAPESDAVAVGALVAGALSFASPTGTLIDTIGTAEAIWRQVNQAIAAVNKRLSTIFPLTVQLPKGDATHAIANSSIRG
jgi:hypothetical protein